MKRTAKSEAAKTAENSRRASEKISFERVAMQDMDSFVDVRRMRVLYDLAVEVCLAKEPELHIPTEISPERAIVQKLGVRGLGIALEMAEDWFSPENISHMEQEICVEEEETGVIYVGRDTITRHPRSFGSEQSPEIVSRFEALGAGMLQEAYRVLGTDVNGHIEALSAAKTVEEQLPHLQWLNNRLDAMEVKDELSKGSAADVLFYHPIRLSAKGIGVYPHLNTSPTCLMKSVIASSFFEQAGVAHLHCGVMSTETTEHRLSLARTMGYLSNSLRGLAPDVLTDALRRADRRNREVMDDIGAHAVATMQLADESWYVCDPNYYASDVLDETNSKRLTDARVRLIEFQDVAPNMELAVPLERGQEDMYAYEIAAAFARSTEVDRDRLRTILTDDDHESVLSRVYEVVQESLHVVCSSVEDLVNDEFRILREEILGSDGYEYSPSLYKYLGDIWHKYVVWLDSDVINDGDRVEDQEKMLQRCKIDPAYLERRIDDIALLPLLALVPAQLRLIESLEERLSRERDRAAYHYALEVGLPAARIGSTIMSDFAVYFHPGEIAPSTWFGNWGSRLPITEHGYYGVNDVRFDLITDMAYACVRPLLKYYQQDGIIIKSRKARERDRSEE